ncbi:hypothetical protein FAZ19_04425 [Sphingobacterium alkalisoli]|uniref:Uncharacterized protein n=1 Tax=Sphingobacterium alkalisoli TaxID=1874115 RepID=A0A4U0H9N7_9SPHI|nr:hypothetical protein [Sphingobacterium alkalisoli]TJY68506.1 hypothetical protein FAZ19_04425 [Sphingobacterium alkalisoli]
MKKYLILFLLSCSTLIVHSQDQDSVTVSKNDIQHMLTMLKEIKRDDNGQTKIGRFVLQPYAFVFGKKDSVNIDTVLAWKEIADQRLKGQRLSVKSLRNATAHKTTLIDSVVITISEGVMEHIQVYTEDGKSFYNIRSPIPILTLEKRFEDVLINPQNGSKILLKDVIFFEAERRFNYFPDEQSLTIRNSKDTSNAITSVGLAMLHAKNNLNSLVNFQVYSDLFGVFGDQPNGLIQFEANTKLYLHRANYPNSYIFMPLDAIEPFFHFNRIESKFDTISVSGTNEINRLELFRRYTYAIGLDANLFRADWRPSNSFEVKGGYMYSSSNLVIDGEKIQAVLHTPYIEAVLKSKKLNNFGFDLRGRYLWQKLNPNELIDNDEWNKMLSFRTSLFYFTEKEKSDKIFLRFINYLNLSDRKQDFSQLQLGFSKAISF